MDHEFKTIAAMLPNLVRGPLRNAWVYGDHFEVYFRVNIRRINGELQETLDLANIVVDPVMQNTGVFTRMVKFLSEQQMLLKLPPWLYLENVLNPEFELALSKNPEWTPMADSNPPSFYRRLGCPA